MPNVSYIYCWKCYSSSSVSNYLFFTFSFTQFSVTPSRFLTVKHVCYQGDYKALGMPPSALSSHDSSPGTLIARPHSVHTHSHIHVAQIAVQVFNDMCVLASVEDGQGPCIALVPHVGICWIDGDSSQVHHEVASKDGAHALAQQVKGSLHTLPAVTPPHPCFLWPEDWSPPPDSPLPETQPVPRPTSRSLELPCQTRSRVPRPGWKRGAVIWEHKSALPAAAQGPQHKAMHTQGCGLTVPSLVQAWLL